MSVNRRSGNSGRLTLKELGLTEQACRQLLKLASQVHEQNFRLDSCEWADWSAKDKWSDISDEEKDRLVAIVLQRCHSAGMDFPDARLTSRWVLAYLQRQRTRWVRSKREAVAAARPTRPLMAALSPAPTAPLRSSQAPQPQQSSDVEKRLPYDPCYDLSPNDDEDDSEQVAADVSDA